MKPLPAVFTIMGLAVSFSTGAYGQLKDRANPIPPEPIAEELKPLQGEWEGEGSGGKCTITITGDVLHYRSGRNWWKTTFSLPAGTTPQQLHATIKDSAPPAESIGDVVTAIFKIEDGTLTLLAYDISDGPPKSFGSTNNRYVVKKVPPLRIPDSSDYFRGADTPAPAPHNRSGGEQPK